MSRLISPQEAYNIYREQARIQMGATLKAWEMLEWEDRSHWEGVAYELNAKDREEE